MTKGRLGGMMGPSVARRGGDADRELGRIAMVLHGLDLDRAQPRGVGDGGAAHAGEDDRSHDIDMPEAALEPADQREREVVDAVGDAGVVHQVAGEDEEGHRQQREAVDAADHAVHHGERRQLAADQDVDQRAAGHRDGHRDATGHHQQEQRLEHGQRSCIVVSGRSSTL
jgi:hypothetical protein